MPGSQSGLKDLSGELRRRLGCKRHPQSGRYIVPSEPTIRRTLCALDADLLDAAMGAWLQTQVPSCALAIDGKTLRGSASKGGRRGVHLLSALLCDSGVVVGQKHLFPHSNEITCSDKLLEDIDLKDKVVTADAMHT